MVFLDIFAQKLDDRRKELGSIFGEAGSPEKHITPDEVDLHLRGVEGRGYMKMHP